MVLGMVGHFRMILKQVCDEIGIELNRFAIILELLYYQFGINLVLCWDDVGFVLGSLWDRFGKLSQ